MIRGRYAPSPTGELHVGNARTALAAWLSVRSRGGQFIWRVEDLDAARTDARLIQEAIEQLRWMGLDWDEGPDVGGPNGPYAQSERLSVYNEALRTLYDKGLLFPCSITRKDLRDLATAPHDSGDVAYPRSLRPASVEPDWFDRVKENATASIRFMVNDSVVTFRDAVYGEIKERVRDTVGDFVLRRRDGVLAYQLAVVVDDLLMGVNEVVRGRDLLSSTGRQLLLIEALGGTPPSYAHVPLLVNESGEKLSKRDHALTVASLRGAGVRPEDLTGYLAWSLGLIERPEAVAPRELVHDFSWDRIVRTDHTLPHGFAQRLTKQRPVQRADEPRV